MYCIVLYCIVLYCIVSYLDLIFVLNYPLASPSIFVLGYQFLIGTEMAFKGSEKFPSYV